jgi:hypothetical protein
MSYRVACYILFDITHTGVINRVAPNTHDILDWTHRRNTQSNFDTILQIISLRAQPEVTKLPVKISMTDDNYDKFGYVHTKSKEVQHCWKFEFEVQHASVFENGIMPFGALYNDCNGVPMVSGDSTYYTVSTLDTSDELRNIYFEDVPDE